MMARLGCVGCKLGWPAVGLINLMGSGHREWQHAALFIRSGTEIVYEDPSMVDPEEIRHGRDQIALSGKALRALCEDESNVMPLDIPFKPPTEATGESKVVCRSVALEVLRFTDSRNLLSIVDKLF